MLFLEYKMTINATFIPPVSFFRISGKLLIYFVTTQVNLWEAQWPKG